MRIYLDDCAYSKRLKRQLEDVKNMTYVDIVRAIGNLIAADMPIVGHIYVLNDWQW